MIDLNAFIPHTWLVLAASGAVLSVLSLVESAVDLMVTKPTNGFRVLAMGDVAQEAIRLVMYTVFAGLGAWALLREAPAAPGGVGWVLVAGLGLLVTKTVIQLLIRRYMRASMRRHLEAAEETQDQREDREFGEQRRALELEHLEEGEQ